MHLQQLFRHVKAHLPASNSKQLDNPNARIDLIYEANMALKDLKTAEDYFNSISQPDLLEYATYQIEAARRKYEYLIRQIRQEEYM